MIELVDLAAGHRGRPVIEHLSGSFAAGSLTALVGPNGAGKTTLLKTIVGLLPPLAGRVVRHGLAPRAVAYLPQHAEIDRSFPISVGDVVMLGHWPRAGAFGGLGREARRAAEAALAEVGLDGAWRRPIGTLSQGQLQRVMVARLLVQDCPVMLLDEPFAAIDSRTTADLLAIVARWHREGRTVIAALHDIDQVRASFPETLLLAPACSVWGRTPRVLTPDNLLRAWGMASAGGGRADLASAA